MAIETTASNYLNVNRNYSAATRLTVAMWVYPNVTGATKFAGLWNSAPNDLQWFIGRTVNDTISIGIYDSWYATQDFGIAWFTEIPTTQWTHLVMVYDPSDSTTSLRIYRNGYNSGGRHVNDRPNGSLKNVSGNFGIGKTDASFDGRIAEFATWTRALTAAEADSLYKGFSPRKIPTPDCYIPLVRDSQDQRGGYAITTTGSPAVFSHPRVYL